MKAVEVQVPLASAILLDALYGDLWQKVNEWLNLVERYIENYEPLVGVRAASWMASSPRSQIARGMAERRTLLWKEKQSA